MEKQYSQNGVKISKQKIERNLLEKAANDWVEMQKAQQDKLIFNARSKRQELFE